MDSQMLFVATPIGRSQNSFWAIMLKIKSCLWLYFMFSKQLLENKNCHWLDSNRGFLVSEATALETVIQPLSVFAFPFKPNNNNDEAFSRLQWLKSSLKLKCAAHDNGFSFY